MLVFWVSVRPTGLPRLSTGSAPGKPEEQGARRGFSPLLLQTPKQSPHRAVQRHQPQRRQQVPGAQRAGQTTQGSVLILNQLLGPAGSAEANRVGRPTLPTLLPPSVQ